MNRYIYWFCFFVVLISGNVDSDQNDDDAKLKEQTKLLQWEAS